MITPLEADQGRVTATRCSQADNDYDPGNGDRGPLIRRQLAALESFAGFLAADGIAVRGIPALLRAQVAAGEQEHARQRAARRH